jgi:outer membrane scaffolding protein for murein synthesis (MipA/OmpV family)
MKKLLVLALATLCSAASAQTPAINPMPDGSRDMYAGLGVLSGPRYDGAGSRKTSVVPVFQVQWSNGIFVSGMSAGMHLSSRPSLEFGPLLQLQPARSDAGQASGPIGPGNQLTHSGFIMNPEVARSFTGDNNLAGMDKIEARLLGGAFFNYYLTPEWRLASSWLYGAGNDHNGAIAELGVQRLAVAMGAHHTLSFSGVVTVVNRSYNQAFFGVTPAESVRSGNDYYAPTGGLQDARISVRWNWALSPSWLVTSNLQAARLLGSAKNSPLVERPTNLTVSAALAYRF